MKKAILAALALVPALTSAVETADVGPGAFQLTGGTALGFTTGSTNVQASAQGTKVDQTTDHTAYGVEAAGLYYPVRNLAVGLSVSYDRSTEKSEGVEERSSALLVGPALSAQHPLGEHAAVFGRGTVGYASAWSTATGEPDIDATGYGFELQAGVRYFVVRQFSIDAGLSYSYLKLKTDEITTSTGIIPAMDVKDVGFGLRAGLSVYFGR